MTSSVMQFDYDGKRQYLDTPGLPRLLRRYQVSYLDGGGCGHGCGLLPRVSRPKNQELFELSNTVAFVLTFMNKLDRDGREPLTSCKNRRSLGYCELPDELAYRDGEKLYDPINQRLNSIKGMSRFCQFRRWGQAFW